MGIWRTFLNCFPLTEKPTLLRETIKSVLLAKHVKGNEEMNTYWMARYFHIHPHVEREKNNVSV